MSKKMIISGAFDDLRSCDLRLLEEAAKLGELAVLLWPDTLIQKTTGQPPRFPFTERYYFLNAIRYVSRVIAADEAMKTDELPKNFWSAIWVDQELSTNVARETFANKNRIGRRVFQLAELSGFPAPVPMPLAAGRKKIIVTGSFDWFHSGHVRFLEEAGLLGDLHVIVGHDANIRQLKGAGHPLLSQDERRYVVGSIKYVKHAMISSGDGWLDAEPEIKKVKPDIYVVNEDGDKGGKREYCGQNGIEYLVLKRTPAPGLPKRSSTDLRGF
ncbi:MAG TPA: adenylyltransferase/cytidyltransferase family protein [Verrucomicrobiae bacterium]|jgi:cytidyltransferase-like protein